MDSALSQSDIVDQFDSPFVHEAFVRAATGRICDGPVETVQFEGYRLCYEVIRPSFGLKARVAKIWAHGYGPLGGAFFDPDGLYDRSSSGFKTVLDMIQEATKADLIVWPYFPLQAREHGWLLEWADQGRHRQKGQAMLLMRAHWRAFLDCRTDVEHIGAQGTGTQGDGSEMGLSLSRNKRKTLGRQSRRLQDLGGVQFPSTTDGLDHESAVESFLRVEASGWKGHAGTALAVDEKLEDFVNGFIYEMLEKKIAQIDLMTLNQDCIAGLVSFRAGRGLFTWKTGMDGVYKRFSPGVHTLLAASRRAIDDPEIDYIDSLADEGHPVAEHLWAGRRHYGQLIIPMNRYGRLAAHSFRAAGVAKDQVRYWAKRLVGRD